MATQSFKLPQILVTLQLRNCILNEENEEIAQKLISAFGLGNISHKTETQDLHAV